MSKLTSIIDDLVQKAEKDPKYPALAKLGGGLQIVICFDGHKFELILTRKSPGPNMQEMKTVLKHWPWALINNPVIDSGLYGDRWPALHCQISKLF